VVTLFISPMLLQSKEQPFEDQGFITELKLDGIRLILSKFDNQIKLFTRQKKIMSQ
jgi:DNA ligase-1